MTGANRLFISITLPAERARPGLVELYRDNAMLGMWPCLGKADNARAAKKGNPSRDPARIKGDTPLGVYSRTAVVQRRHYQPGDGIGVSWVPLEPMSGQALAAKQNGRTALGIHAGRGNRDPYKAASGGFVVTEGCVRMWQKDYDAMAEKIGAAPIEAIAIKEGNVLAPRENAHGAMENAPID